MPNATTTQDQRKTEAESATINAEQGLYVFPAEGGGYSCFGFENADRRLKALRAWLGQPPSEAKPGTLDHLAAYERAMADGQAHHAATGARCNAELTPQLMGLEGRRVEVRSADGSVRRFKVGKSMGWLPCHLELANVRSHGGGPATLAPSDIVRVVA